MVIKKTRVEETIMVLSSVFNGLEERILIRKEPTLSV